jgi:hypothetical protein
MHTGGTYSHTSNHEFETVPGHLRRGETLDGPRCPSATVEGGISERAS